MIVADASLLSNAVGDDGPAGAAARHELEVDPAVAIPDFADVEVLSVLRKRWRAGELSEARCKDALQDLMALPFPRYPASQLLARAFELRNTVSACDAVYVALAELLGATLVTLDARLSRAPGIRCAVRVLQSLKASRSGQP